MDFENQLIVEVPCPICRKWFKNLSYHAAKHDMSAKEFQETYGPMTYLDMVVEKIDMLFVEDRRQWLSAWFNPIINEFTWRWNKVGKLEEKRNKYLDRYFTDKDIKKHLRQRDTGNTRATCGIFYAGSQSKYFCFDIDGKQASSAERQEITEKLIGEIANYIPKKDIHLEYSGKKGYHIWVFFNQLIDIDNLLAFAKSVSAFNFGNDLVNIEFRPESKKSKGVKLPLGRHIDTLNFCYFADKSTFEPIPKQYEYLFTIQQINPLDWNIFMTEKKETSVNATIPKEIIPHQLVTNEYLDNILENGLPGFDTRNRRTYHLAIHMKDNLGYDREDTREALYAFTSREYEAGHTEDSLHAAQSDIDYTVNNVYDNDKHLPGMKLTRFEEQLVANIPGYFNKTLTALLQWGKLWQKNGYFNINANHMAKVTKQSQRTIYRHLDQLEKLCIVFEMWKGSNLEYYKNFRGDRKVFKGRNSLYFMPVLQHAFTRELTQEIFDYYFVPFCAGTCATERAKAQDDLYRYRIILELKVDLLPELEFELSDIVEKSKTDGIELLDSFYSKSLHYYEAVLYETKKPQNQSAANTARLKRATGLLQNPRMKELLEKLGLTDKVTTPEDFDKLFPKAIRDIQLIEEPQRFMALVDGLPEKKI